MTQRSWMLVTSARGPAECQWVARRVMMEIERAARAAGLAVEALRATPGEERETILSALLSIEGEGAAAFVRGWAGTIQWIGASPFRPAHKRRNWFVGVRGFEPPEAPVWRADEVEIQVCRSGGPGGQHVNKTESAVRAIHKPTGLVATAREERSQHQNRRLALARLAARFDAQGRVLAREADEEQWDAHNSLERGNAVRVYAGPDFRLRKGA